MGCPHASLSRLSLLLAFFLGGCVGAEPTVVPFDGTAPTGETGPGKPDAGDGGKVDGTLPDGQGEAAAETGVDAADVVVAPEASVDTGVDAAAVCSATLAAHDGGAAGTLDPSFSGGTVVASNVAAPAAPLIDPAGNIYVIGSLTNCASATSGSDFAVSRFTSAGLLDTAFGPGGTMCVDFIGGNDAAVAGTIDPNGKLVLVGYAQAAADAGGVSTTSLAMARIDVTTSKLDTASFGAGTGKVKVTLLTNNTCSLGQGGCAPPEAQIGEAVTVEPATGTIFVVGTPLSDAAGYLYPGGFIASFRPDGSVNTNFNSTGAGTALDGGVAVAGYLVDPSIDGYWDVALAATANGPAIVVVGNDQGATFDGGTATEFTGRRFVTRRYLTANTAGTLDPAFNAGSSTPGEIRTALGKNDYARAVRVDPVTGDVVVAGLASVGSDSGLYYAGLYGAGFIGAVRYTAAGLLDTNFGSGTGVYVSTYLKQAPAYLHFLLALQCDSSVLLGGYVAAPTSMGKPGFGAGCNPQTGTVGCQTPAVQRLTPLGIPDTSYAVQQGAVDGGVGSGPSVAWVSFPGDVIIGAVTTDGQQNVLGFGGNNSGHMFFERFLH